MKRNDEGMARATELYRASSTKTRRGALREGEFDDPRYVQ